MESFLPHTCNMPTHVRSALRLHRSSSHKQTWSLQMCIHGISSDVCVCWDVSLKVIPGCVHSSVWWMPAGLSEGCMLDLKSLECFTPSLGAILTSPAWPFSVGAAGSDCRNSDTTPWCMQLHGSDSQFHGDMVCDEYRMSSQAGRVCHPAPATVTQTHAWSLALLNQKRTLIMGCFSNLRTHRTSSPHACLSMPSKWCKHCTESTASCACFRYSCRNKKCRSQRTFSVLFFSFGYFWWKHQSFGAKESTNNVFQVCVWHLSATIQQISYWLLNVIPSLPVKNVSS